ncbi:hypothetical protein HD554DRAFT_1989437, partial [Boletus coccyginus]
FLHNNPFKVVTPYRWQAWNSMLREPGVFKIFADVSDGIHFGWHLGVIDSYHLFSSFLLSNHCSAIENVNFILDYIQAKVTEGHYSGPFN